MKYDVHSFMCYILSRRSIRRNSGKQQLEGKRTTTNYIQQKDLGQLHKTVVGVV